MSLTAVREEVASWSPEEQDRLAGYLAVLRLERDPAHAQELSRRLEDPDPAQWLTLDELRRKLPGGA